MDARIMINGNEVLLSGTPEEISALLFGNELRPAEPPKPPKRKPTQKRSEYIKYDEALGMPLEQYLSTRLSQTETQTAEDLAALLISKGIRITIAKAKARIRNALRTMAGAQNAGTPTNQTIPAQ